MCSLQDLWTMKTYQATQLLLKLLILLKWTKLPSIFDTINNILLMAFVHSYAMPRAELMVEVININDNPPKFDRSNETVSLYEESEEGIMSVTQIHNIIILLTHFNK